ncbi:hypothetical protein L1987_45460 [Smallanthus sonchifolius]|uniref:Uncharacterized protein n=1 Tax=Smallanthus sonchifolius TaxID=185202 RepID=A0ACB9FX52_9ASTR|nr:hypothetical protein L1987_45460 [Smallanthus sonchifolius]
MKMNMKRQEKRLFSWRLAGLTVVVVLFISMAEPVKSQSSDRNSTLMRYYCSLYYGRSPRYFLSNLNSTLSSFHQQLTNGSRYDVARTLLNCESVWGLASCRTYVSNANCVACYDYVVAQLRVCGTVNGGRAFYDDCDVKYENNNFYVESNIRAGVVICGNATSPQPANFRKAVEGLMSDLRTAAPRTSNYYAASTRRVPDGNHTVYAIAQCNLNISQSVCQGCLNSRYSSILDSCLPGTTGRAIDNGYFMRYSGTPFFGLNQTTDITPFLGDGDSSKRYIIGGVVGGVCFLLLVLALILWRFRSKSTSSRLQDKSTGSTDLLQGPAKYRYDDIKIATSSFSDEHKLGGGVFGEVYKGTLKDGNTVAIKKTVMDSSRGKIHVDDELKIICDKSVNLNWRQRDSGYVAPEYAIHGQLSKKVDTYSFGIVLLEIISGKRCHNVNGDESFGQNLLDHAWNLYDSGTHLNLVDERLDPSEYAIEDVKKIIEIALMCTQSPVSERPTMSEVVMLLSDKSLDEMPPVRSSFQEDGIIVFLRVLHLLISFPYVPNE